MIKDDKTEITRPAWEGSGNYSIESFEKSLDHIPKDDRVVLEAVLKDAKVYRAIGDRAKHDECLRQFKRALVKISLGKE